MPARSVKRIGVAIDWLLIAVFALMSLGIVGELVLHTSDVYGLIVDVAGTGAIVMLLILRHRHRRAFARLEVGRNELSAQVAELKSTHEAFQRAINGRLDELNLRVLLEDFEQ